MITSLFNSNTSTNSNKKNVTCSNLTTCEEKNDFYCKSYRKNILTSKQNYKNEYIANRIMINKSTSNEIIRMLISNNSFPYINRRVYEIVEYENESVNNKTNNSHYKNHKNSKNNITNTDRNTNSNINKTFNTANTLNTVNTTKKTNHTLSISSHNSLTSIQKQKPKKIIFSNINTYNEKLMNRIKAYSNLTNQQIKIQEDEINNITNRLITIHNDINERRKMLNKSSFINKDYNSQVLRVNQNKMFLNIYKNENEIEIKSLIEYIDMYKEMTNQIDIENKALLIEKEENELGIKKIFCDINDLNIKIKDVNDNKRHMVAFISFIYKNIQKLKAKSEVIVSKYYILNI